MAKDFDSESARQNAAALLMRHSDGLYAYILACVRNRADADDLLQTVAVVVVSSKSVPIADEDFRRWAREIARRRILEHHRRKDRLQVVNPELIERLAEAATWADQHGRALDRRAALLKCVEKLPTDAQALLRHRYGAEINSVEDIAARLGRTVESISSLLYRLREKLRICVEHRLATEGRA